MKTKLRRPLAIVVMTISLTAFSSAGPSSRVPAMDEATLARAEASTSEDCEKARERCVKSCNNFRETCGDTQYCIDQQNECDAG